MCGTLGPLHERSRTAKGGRHDGRAKDVKMGKGLSCEEILLSNAKVWASRETQLLNKTALACNLMVSLWCVIVLGGWVVAGGGLGRQLGWDLKLILWELKLEDYRTNILCKNCARVRCCHHFCERERGVYCPHRSSAPVRITKGWHKFTSSHSPSTKTVIMKLCAPVSMKQPVKWPILVPDNGKDTSLTHTHKHTHTYHVILEIIQTNIIFRISVTWDHSVK